jgi:hypothetical protein
MSDKDQHFNLVDHNYEALSHLSNPNASNYTDWCTTIIFYMTLHYIHAYLADKENIHPGNHTNLDSIISKNVNLRPIYDKYRHLKDDSEDARYEGKILSIYQMRQSVLRYYSDIENKVLLLLGLKTRSSYNLYTLFPLN